MIRAIIVTASVLLAFFVSPPARAQERTASSNLENELRAINEHIENLKQVTEEQNDSCRKLTEYDVERIYREQTEIIRTMLSQISPYGDYGGQLQDIQARFEQKLAAALSHPNPAERARAPQLRRQVAEVIRHRSAIGETRSLGLKMIRELDNELEVAIMLMRADLQDEVVNIFEKRFWC